MITTRYVDVAFNGGRSAMARALYQYDYGQILRITDLEMPVAYEVHFAEGKTGNSVTQIGNADGVNIPDSMLLKSGSFYAWFYLHETANDGETRYEILFPVMQRAKPTNQEPTPVQQDAITEAISALNAAVEQTGADVIAAGESASAAADSANEASGYASDASASAINAGEYAEDAQGYASSASESATAAGNAQTAAETAQGKAETAQGKAEDAQTAAEAAAAQTALDVVAARQSANAAAGSAGEASGYANDASGYATLAQGFANNASGFADNASGYATNAYNSATAAAGSAGEASGYATTASGYASAANDAKLAAQGAQTAAETAQGLAEAAQTGAEAAQTAAESAQDAAVAATEDKAPVILDSASGSIVSIVDGANGMNARSLVVGMEPIQDLHGYSNPWPAGGGKNKLRNDAVSKTENGITFTVNADGSIKAVGTATATTYLKLDENMTYPYGNYKLYGSVGGATDVYDIYLAYKRNGTTIYVVSTDGVSSGTLIVDENTTDIYFAAVRIYNGATVNTTFYPMLLLSTEADTTYAPYSNICPISGRTSLKAYRTGKNLFDDSYPYQYSTKLIVFGGTASYNYNTYLKSGVTYTISVSGVDAYAYMRLQGDSTNKNIKGKTAPSATFSVQKSGVYAVWLFSDESISVADLSYVQIELGSTASAYEPYTGTYYPVSWQTEAGTVYGGTVDVVSGLLTVTMASVDLGALSWQVSGTNNPNKNRFMANLDEAVPNDSASVIPDCVCSQYPTVSANNTYMLKMGLTIYKGGNVHNYVYIYDAKYDTVTADVFATAIQGVQLVYDLATPQTYQLTPTQVSMLLGANNVLATGDTVSLTYPCDTKLYIARLTAPTEDDMVANANIPIHKFFMIGNGLYYSTAAIAQGAAIVVGTNCAMVSLAEALNQLNS